MTQTTDLTRFVVIASNGRVAREWNPHKQKWVKFRVTWEFWRIGRSYHGSPAIVDLGDISEGTK